MFYINIHGLITLAPDSITKKIIAVVVTKSHLFVYIPVSEYNNIILHERLVSESDGKAKVSPF